MLDTARNRPAPPSLADPPEWLAQLRGIEHFRSRPTEHGWTAKPEGMTEDIEFPGGTWRVVMLMPADLSITEGFVDPLVLLIVVANGAAKVDDKIQELVAHCRSTGKSWTQIGQALGMTKQAAWERFSGEEQAIGEPT
jgi:hypothetical protein